MTTHYSVATSVTSFDTGSRHHHHQSLPLRVTSVSHQNQLQSVLSCHKKLLNRLACVHVYRSAALRCDTACLINHFLIRIAWQRVCPLHYGKDGQRTELLPDLCEEDAGGGHVCGELLQSEG